MEMWTDDGNKERERVAEAAKERLEIMVYKRSGV